MTEALMIDNTARYSSTCMTPINDRDNTENVCHSCFKHHMICW